MPDEDDFEGLLTPPAVGVAWVRRVKGAQLWVLYRFDDARVSLRELATRRPVRVESE